MVAVLAALAVSYALTRHLPIMPVVTAVIVVVFGGLTLILHDATFIKVKPTIIYALFGAILIGGLIFNKPLLGIVFDSMFHITEEGWRKLTWRWAIFFLVLAVLNEIVWRNTSTNVWVDFKVFGVMPLTFLFGALHRCRCSRNTPSNRPSDYDPAASALSICGLSTLSRFSSVIGPTSL